jgi:hypothetical protein
MMKNQKLGREGTTHDFTVNESKIKDLPVEELEREH